MSLLLLYPHSSFPSPPSLSPSPSPQPHFCSLWQYNASIGTNVILIDDIVGIPSILVCDDRGQSKIIYLGFNGKPDHILQHLAEKMSQGSMQFVISATKCKICIIATIMFVIITFSVLKNSFCTFRLSVTSVLVKLTSNTREGETIMQANLSMVSSLVRTVQIRGSSASSYLLRMLQMWSRNQTLK